MSLNAGDRYREATRVWREADNLGPDAEAPRAIGAERIAAMQAAIRAVPLKSLKQQNRRQALAFFCAAAALVSLGFGLSRWRNTPRAGTVPRDTSTLRAESSSAILIRGGTTRFVEPGTSAGVRAGDEISVAPGGKARLRLPSAALIELEAATRVRVGGVDEDESVDLVRGAVSLRVPRLPPPHTLSVTTPDARVVVHGTQFRVALTGPNPLRAPETSVAVSEGEVAVIVPTGHRILRKGEQWHSSEAALTPSEPPPPSSASEPAASAQSTEVISRGPAFHETKPTAVPSAPPPREPSTAAEEALAEQNRLYRSALAAKRVGDARGSVTLLSELIERYPDSPLAAEAFRERARLQARSARDGGW